jgi:phospholipid/cholesterol/gamma-HCH transport system substrate-binding protein
MALRRRSARHTGMSPFKAGLIAIAVLAVLTYFGFTKANPFANPYKLEAVFQTVNNLKPNSPVRIAGVDVGKVKQVEHIDPEDGQGARVTMELQDKGLPIHEDAELKIRPRIFLEGNFFVDLKPGSPSAPVVDDGGTIPMQQTAGPVQFGDLLTALQSDTREDLKTLLAEFAVKGLGNGGAAGFNESIQYWRDAYRNSSLANDATLGQQPDKDLQRMLKGQARTFRALVEDERALKDLVTNFNVTAGAFAREDEALEASIPELRDTLRVAQPALRSLNDSLPSLRAFARDALPGTRSSDETLAASMPFIRQARKLVSRRELRGLAAELRRQIPNLVALNETSVPVLEQSRALSACTNDVLVPFVNLTIPDVAGPDGGGNNNQEVVYQLQRGLPGLSGESRLSDGNNQWFHTMAVPNATQVQPVPPTVVDQPPPRRPDVPCETQDPPDLHAASAPVTAFGAAGDLLDGGGGFLPIPLGQDFDVQALRRARDLTQEIEAKRGAHWDRLAAEAEAEGGDRR